MSWEYEKRTFDASATHISYYHRRHLIACVLSGNLEIKPATGHSHTIKSQYQLFLSTLK